MRLHPLLRNSFHIHSSTWHRWLKCCHTPICAILGMLRAGNAAANEGPRLLDCPAPLFLSIISSPAARPLSVSFQRTHEAFQCPDAWHLAWKSTPRHCSDHLT